MTTMTEGTFSDLLAQGRELLAEQEEQQRKVHADRLAEKVGRLRRAAAEALRVSPLGRHLDPDQGWDVTLAECGGDDRAVTQIDYEAATYLVYWSSAKFTLGAGCDECGSVVPFGAPIGTGYADLAWLAYQFDHTIRQPCMCQLSEDDIDPPVPASAPRRLSPTDRLVAALHDLINEWTSVGN